MNYFLSTIINKTLIFFFKRSNIFKPRVIWVPFLRFIYMINTLLET